MDSMSIHLLIDEAFFLSLLDKFYNSIGYAFCSVKGLRSIEILVHVHLKHQASCISRICFEMMEIEPDKLSQFIRGILNSLKVKLKLL